jgi:very-short-patch-repair endonuclease
MLGRESVTLMRSKREKNLPLDGGGKVGVKKRQTFTQFARQLRKNQTDAEQLLWRYLRLRQLDGHKFRRQQPIGPYVVDFVCFDQKLIVEVDGGQHTQNQSADEQRTDWLSSQGFRVLRFWNHDVLQDTDAVLTAIKHALEEASPHPPPLPQGGEGNYPSPQPSPTRGEGETEGNGEREQTEGNGARVNQVRAMAEGKRKVR